MDGPGRDHLVPFLVVAYPATFAILQARPYCGPGCGGPSPLDLGALVAVAAGSLLAATLVGRPLLDRAVGRPDRSAEPFVESVRSPSGATVAVLLGVSLAFAAFLVLDVADVAEASWKPFVLPASLLLFAPVWALYTGTTVLGLTFEVVGVESTQPLRWVVLALVVGAGFAASAIWQFLVVESLLGRRR